MKLKDLIESNNTGLDAIKRAPIVDYDTGIRCIRIGDISNNRPFNEWGYTIVDDVNYNKFQLKTGDIIVARTGATIGVNKYIDNDYKSVYNNGLIRLRVNKDNNPKYVYYLLQSNNYKRFIKTISMGTSTQPNMQMNDLLNLEVPEFDRNTQDKIVKILGKIDDKIKLNNEINNNLYDEMQTLYNEWFKLFSPFKNGKFKTTELGDIPDKFIISDIYSIANIIYGAPFKSKLFNEEKNGNPIIRIRDLKEQSLKTYTPEIHPKGYLLQKGDIAVGMDGEFKPYFWGNEEAWLNQRVCVFENKRKKGKAFLYYTIKPLLDFIEKTEVATTVIHIGKNDFDNFKIILPNEEIMSKFDEITDPMVNQIIQNMSQNHLLEKLRDTLLPKLMNGEINLDNIEI